MLFQLIGSFLGPILVGYLLPFTGLGNALLWVCTLAWGISLLLLIALCRIMPQEIEGLRKRMAYRSQLERQLKTQKAD